MGDNSPQAGEPRDDGHDDGPHATRKPEEHGNSPGDDDDHNPQTIPKPQIIHQDIQVMDPGNIDHHMRSLSPISLHPQGSSRAMGGILRGHAQGNTFNHADQDEIEMDLLKPAQEKVKLYVSRSDPASFAPSAFNITTFMNCRVFQTFAPVLQVVARRFTLLNEPNQFIIFVREDNLWSLKGHFDVAIIDNDDITWSRENQGFTLHILLSTFQLSFHQATSPPVTVASGSRSRSQTAQASTSDAHDHIAAVLGIDLHLRDSDERGVLPAYKKYKAYLAALQEHQRLSSPDDWSGSRPPARDIVEVFFSRSMFYSHYRKFFAGISHYPMMYTWLEQEGKGPLTNLEVWGVNLTSSSYKFSHLEAWIANGETLIVDINVNKEDKKG
ncbi:hypothetical protein BD779DRAFT_1631679, partial [Infundibulicybe gibba]